MKEWCGSCRFFMVGTSAGFPEMEGMCRRYAPQGPVIGSGKWQTFPPMSVHQWCGEHQPLRSGGWAKRMDDLEALTRKRKEQNP